MSGVVTVRDLAPRWLLPADLVADPYDPADPDDPGARPVRRSARDWLMDTAAFLLAAGWAALMSLLVWADLVPVAGGLLAADLAAGWLACVALWLRRRWPVVVAVALVPTGAFSMSAAAAALIALFTVVVYRRPAVGLVLGGVFAATALPYFVYHINPVRPHDSYWSSIIWATIVTALVVSWGMFARARRQLVLSLRDRAHRAEAEQQLRAEQARHLERERIAREMHDVLAHRISLVSMHAGALEYRTGASPAEVTRVAGVIRDNAHHALQDLREVIGVLRAGPDGDTRRPQPALADLPALLDEARQAGTRVRWDGGRRFELGTVPAAVGRTAYRIVQEGLTNARKHAPGTAVDLTLAGTAGTGLTVEVRNPRPAGGVRAPEIPGAGTGLVGLAERVALAGGRLEHGPAPDGGFRLWAWLPWPA